MYICMYVYIYIYIYIYIICIYIRTCIFLTLQKRNNGKKQSLHSNVLTSISECVGLKASRTGQSVQSVGKSIE